MSSFPFVTKYNLPFSCFFRFSFVFYDHICELVVYVKCWGLDRVPYNYLLISTHASFDEFRSFC